MFNFNNIIRENIKQLQPYASARDEFNGNANIFLDANENSLGSAWGDRYNRYPDPHQRALKQAIGRLKQTAPENIFIGNGSDECIDLLYRCCCNPGTDNCIICPPTYGMYEVCGRINDIEIRTAPLQEDFQPDLVAIEALTDEHTRILWLCSPNNPSGNCMRRDALLYLLLHFNGLVVIDEAYIDFAAAGSFLPELANYPNLVLLQTLSKAWGLAALRLGMAFASPEIIRVLDKVKPPYNINGATQEIVLEALQQAASVKEKQELLLLERETLRQQLSQLPFVENIFPSDANFLLVKVKDPNRIYAYLLTRGIVVRNRNAITGCTGCLRITVGTPNENEYLMNALINYTNSSV